MSDSARIYNPLLKNEAKLTITFLVTVKGSMEFRTSSQRNSTPPTVCDKLNIMAAIHNRKLITTLVRELKEKDSNIEKFEERILSIENELKEGVHNGLHH